MVEAGVTLPNPDEGGLSSGLSRFPPCEDPKILRDALARLIRDRFHRTVTTPRRKAPKKSVATVPEPRAETSTGNPTCEWCGSPMARRRGKRFCTPTCRAARWDSLHPRLTLRPKDEKEAA
jgi:hypothetical protein